MNFRTAILLLFFLTSRSKAQSPLEKVLSQENNTFIADTVADTLLNGVRMKVFSQYGDFGWYHKKIHFKNNLLESNSRLISFDPSVCQPCYIYHYRDDGTIYQEGVYKGVEFTTANRKIGIEEANNGTVYFFNTDGDTLLAEIRNIDGLSMKPYYLLIPGDLKFKLKGRTLLINDTVDIGSFKNIQFEPDTIKNRALNNDFVLYFEVWQDDIHFELLYKVPKAAPISYSFKNLGTFNGRVNIHKPMRMLIRIWPKDEMEFIETHYLVMK